MRDALGMIWHQGIAHRVRSYSPVKPLLSTINIFVMAEFPMKRLLFALSTFCSPFAVEGDQRSVVGHVHHGDRQGRCTGTRGSAVGRTGLSTRCCPASSDASGVAVWRSGRDGPAAVSGCPGPAIGAAKFLVGARQGADALACQLDFGGGGWPPSSSD